MLEWDSTGVGDGGWHSATRVRAIEKTPGWQHALMQDPADENAFVINPVEDDMFLVLDPTVSGPEMIAGATHLRQRGKLPEAMFQ
jgi:hypothetical protein